MRKRNFSSQNNWEDESSIDLTPMLDVVFIMLIFFIVTASFVKESGIEVNRPAAETAQLKDNTTILVAINADNEVWIDQRPIDVRSVSSHIARLHSQNPEGGVVIQADELASVRTFTQVLDAAREVVAHDKISLSATTGR